MRFDRRYLRKDIIDKLQNVNSLVVTKNDLYSSGALVRKTKKNNYIPCDSIEKVSKLDTLECDRIIKFLNIKSSYVGWITKELHCDYYGCSDEQHIIAEFKSSISDAEKGVFQIYRYERELKRLKAYQRHIKPIKLFLIYKGTDVVRFEMIHSLYIENCCKDSRISFVYFDQNNELVSI